MTDLRQGNLEITRLGRLRRFVWAVFGRHGWYVDYHAHYEGQVGQGIALGRDATSGLPHLVHGTLGVKLYRRLSETVCVLCVPVLGAFVRHPHYPSVRLQEGVYEVVLANRVGLVESAR